MKTWPQLGLYSIVACMLLASSPASAFRGGALLSTRDVIAPRQETTRQPTSTRMCAPAVQGKHKVEARLGRRSVFPLLILPSVVLTAAGAAVAQDDEKTARAEKLKQAMAVVTFTKTIDEATNKALKLQDKGDFKGAEKQWNIVVDTYESGEDGVVVSSQAVYRLGKSLGLRADVRSELGQRSKSETKLTQAIEDYQRSLAIVDSAEVRIKLATVLLLVKRDADAEKEFDKVLEADVGNQVKGRAYNNRGLVKQQQGKWKEAAEDFQEAVSITQGGSPEAMKNLALAKFEAGDEAGSLTMLKQQSKDAIFGTVEGVRIRCCCCCCC